MSITDCSGKIALVTGAGTGIGRAAAIALAHAGAHLFVTDINLATANETAQLITAAGGRAVAHQQDVSDENRWADIFAAVEAEAGGLDILVNNAGIAIGSPITEMRLEDWRQQIAVNLDGVFLGTRGAIPLMRGRQGSIINISSVAGLVGARGLSGYCATKGGVRLFTKAVALEMADAGETIRVNSIHPGIIDTAIWDKEIGGMAGSMPQLAAAGINKIDAGIVAAGMVPGGKLGTAEDIANAVVFLASDASKYMTGAELVVDHGVTAG
jgi:NAD(P)-dependent dehydrogenase (short-subunit alcohol dehydrogenase family)